MFSLFFALIEILSDRGVNVFIVVPGVIFVLCVIQSALLEYCKLRKEGQGQRPKKNKIFDEDEARRALFKSFKAVAALIVFSVVGVKLSFVLMVMDCDMQNPNAKSLYVRSATLTIVIILTLSILVFSSAKQLRAGYISKSGYRFRIVVLSIMIFGVWVDEISTYLALLSAADNIITYKIISEFGVVENILFEKFFFLSYWLLTDGFFILFQPTFILLNLKLLNLAKSLLTHYTEKGQFDDTILGDMLVIVTLTAILALLNIKHIIAIGFI